MRKFNFNTLLIFFMSGIALADNSEVLRLNFSEETAATSNLYFYLVGLAILLVGIVSSELFHLTTFSKYLRRPRVEKLFLKAQVALNQKISSESLQNSYEVYVRAMDERSVDFVSQRKFHKNLPLHFKLSSLAGFEKAQYSSEVPDDDYFNLEGKVVFSKQVDRNHRSTFLTRVQFPIITKSSHQPLLKYLEKLNTPS